ncbi:hypothetical protein GNF82_14255 [Clostridium perfringens]
MLKDHIRRSLVETFDTSTGTVNTEINLNIPVEIIQKGFIGKIGGPKHFTVLMIILSHSNGTGESYPTQEKIAKLAGLSRQTVNKIVAELLETKYDGENIIQKYSSRTGKFANNVYTYMDSFDKPTDSRIYNSPQEVIEYFVELYREIFNMEYIPSWTREVPLVRNKLFKVLPGEHIKAIIDISVTEYKERWANANYPRPTIGQICGWLGKAALDLHQERLEKEKEQQEMFDIDVEAEMALAAKYL